MAQDATRTPAKSVTLFLAILVIATMSKVLVASIPSISAIRPGANTLVGSITLLAGAISGLGIFSALGLVPAVIASQLTSRSVKRILFGTSVLLLACVTAIFVLAVIYQISGNPRTRYPTGPTSWIQVIANFILALLPVIVPLGAAIWLTARLWGRAALTGVVSLAGLIAIITILSRLALTSGYSGHFAYALYSLIFVISFRRLSGGLRVWGGLLAAIWLLPFILVWVPNLFQASLIDSPFDRFNGYRSTIAFVPPVPGQTNPLVPLMFAGMLVFFNRSATYAAPWLAGAVGVMVLALAIVPLFPVPFLSLILVFEWLRFGGLPLGSALMSGLIWLVLVIGPVILAILSARLYFERAAISAPPTVAAKPRRGS